MDKRCCILTVLLSVWMQPISALSIQLIPQYPAVGQSVTLSVTGINGTIRVFSWYKGPNINADNQILSYIPSANPPQANGNQYFSRAMGLPNGSLLISDLVITDYIYTVYVQTDRAGGAQQESVKLDVYDAPETQFFVATLEVNVGSHLDLQCGADSFKSNIYNWTFNGAPLNISKSTLHIENAQNQHQGCFTCEMHNPVTMGYGEATLHVKVIDAYSFNGTVITGIICGTVLGVILAISATYLLYKKKVTR
ncbi:carcinoembryonic antigen-related cell adhesion molecule 1-like [Pelobates cultripes]|uniref:Carcinoembryonic antigen-related cell adhesion molecule 1-like n=1 Tax=Pelobates cultripes TaxID=61616 RepID=A0AAD1TAJ1_PELCU|nr:carcinoembryonic antigen-related cell adhesion molecule 1-like [Pelobates cultripes]